MGNINTSYSHEAELDAVRKENKDLRDELEKIAIERDEYFARCKHIDKKIDYYKGFIDAIYVICGESKPMDI